MARRQQAGACHTDHRNPGSFGSPGAGGLTIRVFFHAQWPVLRRSSETRIPARCKYRPRLRLILIRLWTGPASVRGLSLEGFPDDHRSHGCPHYCVFLFDRRRPAAKRQGADLAARLAHGLANGVWPSWLRHGALEATTIAAVLFMVTSLRCPSSIRGAAGWRWCRPRRFSTTPLGEVECSGDPCSAQGWPDDSHPDPVSPARSSHPAGVPALGE